MLRFNFVSFYQIKFAHCSSK